MFLPSPSKPAHSPLPLQVTLRVRTGDFLSLIRKAQNSRGNLHSTDPLGKPRRGIPRDDGADRRSSTPSTPQQQKPLTPPSQQHHEQQQTSPQVRPPLPVPLLTRLIILRLYAHMGNTLPLLLIPPFLFV